MKSSKATIVVAVFIAVLAGMIISDFGESWDELQFYKYANLALKAYVTWPANGTVPLHGNTYDNYGPAFVMLITLAAKPLQLIFSESDARHYLYFLTFLAGTWAFYELARRWLAQNAAIFSTLLFATQPVILGHAFFSPKDIPFLSFLLLSLHFGLKLFDLLEPIDLQEVDPRSKRILVTFLILWLATTFGSFLATELVHEFITGLVTSAKAGETNLITYLASDLSRTDPGVYVQRYFVIFLWMRAAFFILSSALLLFLAHRFLPGLLRLLSSILFPAMVLGFTTSIRVLGPFVALFVAYHAFRKHGRPALLPLSMYAAIAITTMYLTWPYLWLDPLEHFIESVLVMSQYPWNGRVLFAGAMYPSTGLPAAYLPVLFGIQFTEPVWVLALLGLVAAATGSREKRELVLFFTAWFLVPLMGFILLRSPLYDNFRQVFFIVPPVFMLAGVIIEKIRDTRWQGIFIFLAVLPGLIGVIRLHPYEYVYYNSLAGGVQGAFRRFELDYWGTSYREAAEYINAVAPNGVNVWVDGPAHIFELYARPDIKIYSDHETDSAESHDYVVSTSRYNLDITSHPEAKVIHVIERDQAVLTVIKQP